MSEGINISNFTEYIQRDEKVLGVMIGVVIKNDSANDSQKPGLGLVKLQIPLLGMKESNWARIASFMAGKERGAFFLPEVGDEVLVAFENGDVNKPFIIGALWNGKDTPPEKNSDGKNNIRVIKSRSGHIFEFSDKSGEERILLKSSKGHIVQIDDKSGAESIQIIDKSGSNKLTISTKDNKITINSGNIEFSAPNGKLSINAKDIEIKSSAATKIEASAGIDIKASSNMTIKGATVNIN
ncbi:phage baseplate assembly protein V [Ruminiclostridium cellulolyticum]|uniref:Rhs element Vgr protein n=1 Tax=Ruminiclostridium cellulolyticum (strain ATCC 35319 / DSM 5812 / JCM 6584 / H10) TaxID=394503 RepID=B8I235_RUMCH|nr:phage baseplate assembly protein V [Ruminiclostridium cellulolyticum]ACL75861.1 Rhs element Vgr protein [Ruminiclostridium cellulolyticum H10]